MGNMFDKTMKQNKNNQHKNISTHTYPTRSSKRNTIPQGLIVKMSKNPKRQLWGNELNTHAYTIRVEQNASRDTLKKDGSKNVWELERLRLPVITATEPEVKLLWDFKLSTDLVIPRMKTRHDSCFLARFVDNDKSNDRNLWTEKRETTLDLRVSD